MRKVIEQLSQSEVLKQMNQKLTFTEIGVIASLLISTASGVFMLGVVYADVNRNADDIRELKPLTRDVAEIKANVEFLSDLAREERHRKNGGGDYD